MNVILPILLWFILAVALIYFSFIIGYKVGVATGAATVGMRLIDGKEPTKEEVAKKVIWLLKHD